MCRFLAMLVVAGLAAGLAPAAAQFGGIFGDPPRPPGNVPSRPPAPPADDRFIDQRRPVRQYQAPQYPGPAQQYPTPVPQNPEAAPPDSGVGAAPPTTPAGIQQQTLPPPPGVPAEATTAPGAPLPTPQPGVAPGAPTSPRGPQQADIAPQPGDEVVIAPSAQKIVNPTAVFSGLDKITGRITSFDVAINETVQFGALRVTPRACYTRPPTETQNTDAFVAVDEVTLQGEVKRIFTGWMFAASPGLHAVEHPIYDVWLTDCKGGSPPTPVAEAQPAPPSRAARTPPRQPAPPRGFARPR